MCRFCRHCACVEDETYDLFVCGDPWTKALRDWFFSETLEVYHINLPCLLQHSSPSPEVVSHILLQ